MADGHGDTILCMGGGERGSGGTSGRGDMEDALDDRDPADNRFSDLREGVRGNDENRFRLAARVPRRRGLDEGLPSSPSSLGTLGGEREVERLRRLI